MNKLLCALSISIFFSLGSALTINNKIYQTATKDSFAWYTCMIYEFPTMPSCGEIKDDQDAQNTCSDTYAAFMGYYGFPSQELITPECQIFQNDVKRSFLENNFKATYPDCLNSIIAKIQSQQANSKFFNENILTIFLKCGGISAQETGQINSQQ
ncbi:hypothetical protein ABPG74_019241 [Tetrahymena malaccensis]